MTVNIALYRCLCIQYNRIYSIKLTNCLLQCPVAWSAARPTGIQEVACSILEQNSFVEIGQEIISSAILSLPLIQVGQFSITGESTGKPLRSKPAKEMCVSMIIVVDWDIKEHHSIKQSIS